MIASEPIAADPPLHLSYIKGWGKRLVLSFAGVGHIRSEPPQGEFARLAGCDGENHVLLISDASRSWMNAPGLVAGLDAAIARLCDRIAPERIVSIGNSMGGSSALIYAGHATVHGVLAFVPQFSVCRAVMRRGNRWRHFTDSIRAWPFPAVPDLSGRGKDVMIVHGGTRSELIHASRFARHDDIDHILFPRDNHQLAFRLRESGVLQTMVRAVIEGRMADARQAMAAAGGMRWDQFEAFRHRKEMKAAARQRRAAARQKPVMTGAADRLPLTETGRN